jgi:hypothetical protein
MIWGESRIEVKFCGHPKSLAAFPCLCQEEKEEEKEGRNQNFQFIHYATFYAVCH